jgi:hypothetical protein
VTRSSKQGKELAMRFIGIAILLVAGLHASAQQDPQTISAANPPNSPKVNRPMQLQTGPSLLSRDPAEPTALGGTPTLARAAIHLAEADALSGAAPAPAAAMALVVPRRLAPPEAHAFFDKKNLTGFAVHGAVRIADATQSCVLLGRPGRREAWLPTQSCGAIAAYSLAMVPAQIGSSYLLHRTQHHRLERWLPYAWAAPSALGVALSIKAW